MEAFLRAAAEFAVADLELEAAPPAISAAQRSLDDSGLLLLGEVHGVRENPLLIRALMQEFGLTSLALEWPDDLAPVVAAFLAGETLADHPMLWSGDGRITAGHLAVLAERAAAGPLELTLFDGTIGAGGYYYNLRPGRFAPTGLQRRQVRLYQHDDALALDLPSASEAVVPQRSQPWPPPARNAH